MSNCLNIKRNIQKIQCKLCILELAEWLHRPLPAHTPRTIVDPKRLRAELARIRRQGWSQDKGETAPSINAFAAPVYDTRDEMVGALSVPFLAGTGADRAEEIRLATIAAAKAISAAIPGPVAR